MTQRAFKRGPASSSGAVGPSIQMRGARGPVSDAPTAARSGFAVQAKAASPREQDEESPQAIAARGLKGGGSALPHKKKIEASFGQDLSDVRAHTGPAAEEACDELGADAFAMGDDIAFKKAPSVELAAHEAAHTVQQKQGVSLSGGVGQEGDKHEQAADKAGALAASGKSAAGVLGTESAGTGVQKKASLQLHASKDQVQLRPGKKKTVSSSAMKRLGHSRKAIAHTKKVLKNGGGNQKQALLDSNFNSYFRMAAMRDNECWEISREVMPYARKYPEALTAAKASLAGGGNCGEHAAVAFDWLRVNAAGEDVNRVGHSMDHAFVLIGDLAKEDGAEVVACDPWPTKPTACLWEDHFAYTTDAEKMTTYNTMSGGGEDIKAIILAGLSLSAKGEAYVKHAYDEKKTKDAVEDGRTTFEEGSQEYPEGRKRWIWDHADAVGSGKLYDYVPAKEVEQADPERIAPAPDIVQDPAHTEDSGFGRFIKWIRSWFS